MILRKRTEYGQSLLEFVALVMFILAAFIIFQKYIVRGLSGRWKAVGDTFGEGRIYDPNKTVECATNVFLFDGASIGNQCSYPGVCERDDCPHPFCDWREDPPGPDECVETPYCYNSSPPCPEGCIGEVEGIWYDQRCFERRCIDDCLGARRNPWDCETCLNGCRSLYCEPEEQNSDI